MDEKVDDKIPICEHDAASSCTDRGGCLITLHELLADKTYREFFTTKPTHVPKNATWLTPPWRVYVQRKPGGPWARKSFDTYAEAFKWLKPRLGNFHDATINCPKVSTYGPTRRVRVKGKFVRGSDGIKRQATKVVAWKPKIPLGEDQEHRWCLYCRRPTVFQYFRRHHSVGKIEGINRSFRRCTICGASTNLMPRSLYPVRY